MPKCSAGLRPGYANHRRALSRAIGQRIHDRRSALGLSQEDLRAQMALEQVHISRSEFSRIEIGESLPDAAALVALVTILRVPCSWLLFGTDESSKPSPEHFQPAYLLGAHESPDAAPSSHRTEILRRLEQAVTQIQDSDTFRRYLDVQSRFHRYSWGNVLLIQAQRPNATQVAGYQTWRTLHRQVRRGEKAIKIIVPFHHKPRTLAAEEEAAGAPEEPAAPLAFGIGNVFDVSQTEGEPLPDIAVPILEGAAGATLSHRLEELAHQQGLAILRATGELPGQAMGPIRLGKSASWYEKRRPYRWPKPWPTSWPTISPATSSLTPRVRVLPRPAPTSSAPTLGWIRAPAPFPMSPCGRGIKRSSNR